MVKLRKSEPDRPVGGIVGPVRFVRTDDLSPIRPGDIVLVDLVDLDARRAHELVERQVAAVLNAATSTTGRLPNQGPSILANAAVPLYDIDGATIWSTLRNGETIQVLDGRVLRAGIPVATGVEHDGDRVTSDLKRAEDSLATRLDSLTANAADHIQREQAMLLDGARVPHIRTQLAHRTAIVVSDDFDAKADLASLKRYIRDTNPVLIGAGTGADVILAAGHTPHLVVGMIDHLSEKAVKAADEIVVTTATGRVTRPERLERHGKAIVTFTSTGSDDDLAILLADTNGAAVIIHAGAPPSLSDLLEQAPSEAARLFVARLRAGSKIVDAKSVARLSARPMSWKPLVLMLLVGVLAVAVAIAVTPLGQDWVEQIGDALGVAGSSIEGILP